MAESELTTPRTEHCYGYICVRAPLQLSHRGELGLLPMGCSRVKFPVGRGRRREKEGEEAGKHALLIKLQA
jgi:hypothetical protein